MDLQEQYIADYTEGYNDASLLALFAPETLSDIVQDTNAKSDYFQGFFDGKSYYQEQARQNELHELASLRQESKERDNERER